MPSDAHHVETGPYTISNVLCGGEKAGEDPGHVAVAVYHSIDQLETCHLHHARCPYQVRSISESRPEQCFDANPAPHGQCNMGTDLSFEDAYVANDVLACFGADKTQLP
jgi:hypothetical protein